MMNRTTVFAGCVALVSLFLSVQSPRAQGAEPAPGDPAYQERLSVLESDVQRLRADIGAERAFTAGWDRGFYLRSADGDFRLNIGGWIQPRYEFRAGEGEEDTSSFTMRRVRLDLRGHVLRPELTFRVMSEHARSSNLRDAWIDYAFTPAMQLRAGQFTVPFQWHRFIGPRRQHFAERGVPSETFGFLQGRDIGIMAHGRLMQDRLAYGAGLFDGAGRNVDVSNSSGHMASARATWAALGALPREESDYAGSKRPQVSIGAGVQGAWRNERRDWALGRSEEENGRGDWITGTVDTRVAWRGISLAADGYLRRVDPEDITVAACTGWAYMISAGYFVVPRSIEVVGRWSQLQADQDDLDTRRDEWGAGVNVYHRGHDWKTRINYLVETGGTEDDVRTFLVEWHLQF